MPDKLETLVNIPDRYWSDEEAERETPNPDLDSIHSVPEARASKGCGALSAELGLHAGDKIGRYLLLSTLGVGGMGVVFSAFDPDLNRKVALKFIRAESNPSIITTSATLEAQSRLIQEAQAMARLAHPNVVAVYDVGTKGAHVYLAMELIEGQTMKAWIRQGGYKLKKLIRIVLGAGRGLACAHNAGFVHRDFKPDNILLGDDGRICVADFGLVFQEREVRSLPISGLRSSARDNTGVDSTTEALSEMGTMLGTPSYMSPEQHRGELATALSDQFSFCVTLFEAAYGVRPFLGRNMGEISAAIECGRITEPSGNNRVPRWLRRIILRGLANDPKDRYASMHELLEDLAIDRDVRLRKMLAGGVASLMMVGGIAYQELSRTQARQRCRAEDLEVNAIWNSMRRTAVRTVFQDSGLRYAESAWTSVDEIMKWQLEEWSEVAVEVCERTFVQGLQSESDLDMQMACLQTQREQLRTYSELLANADSTTIAKSVSAAKSMSPSEDCLDLDRLQKRVPLPVDPHHRVIAQQLREDLNRASMMRTIGKHHSSRELTEEIEDRALAIDYAPILAETYYLMAWQYADAFENRRAQAYNQKALVYAEISADEEFAVNIASQGIFVNGHLLAGASDTDAWVSHARAHLLRAENPPIERAKWLSNTGAAYGTNGRLKESEAVFRESLNLYDRELGHTHRETILVRNNLAVTLAFMNRESEAASHFRKAIADTEATLGLNHPFLILPASNLSLSLSALGKFEEAIQVADRAVDIAESTSGVDAPQSTREYIRRAKLLLRAGKYQRALREWERNVRLIDPKRPVRYGVDAYSGLSDALLRLGRLEEAREVLKHVQIQRRSPTDGIGWERVFLRSMQVFLAEGKFDEASRVFHHLMDFGVNLFGSAVDRGGELALIVGNLKLAEGDLKEAQRFHRLAYERAQERFPGESNANWVPYERALARTMTALQYWPKAVDWMNAALAKLHYGLSDSPHLLASAYLQLATILRQSGREMLAYEAIDQALILVHGEEVQREMDPRELAEIRQFALNSKFPNSSE